GQEEPLETQGRSQVLADSDRELSFNLWGYSGPTRSGPNGLRYGESDLVHFRMALLTTTNLDSLPFSKDASHLIGLGYQLKLSPYAQILSTPQDRLTLPGHLCLGLLTLDQG
ncbi:hypothetical protein BGW38_009263, partial [Lunasporangiospora selenospora]